MKILAVETSTNRGSVALITDRRVQELHWERSESHSEILTSKVQEILDKNGVTLRDLTHFATGVGPGSFTGIRVGVNFCKSCSYIQNRPAIVANSLELIAAEKLQHHKQVIVALQAFRNLIYVGKYHRNSASPVSEIAAPKALTFDEFAKEDHSEYAIVGDLPLRYPKARGLHSLSTFADIDLPKASSFQFFAQPQPDQRHVLTWNEIVPLYIRASEAEEKLRESLFKRT